MNATQLAKYLGLSLQTVYGYIKSGVIVPENLDSWQIDNQYIISDEEAERVKELLRPDGLTTKEVSEIVGCEQRHVIAAIDEGRLNARVRDITQRKQYFVQDDEKLQEFKRWFIQENKQETNWIDPQNKLYLFQSFYHKTDGTLARIMDLNDLSQVATDEQGMKITIERLKEEYGPIHKYQQEKAIHKPGFCILDFIYPSHIKALTFDFIEYVIDEIGINNCDIVIADNKIIFSFKPTLLKISDDMVNHADKCLIKGSILERKEDVYFDSDDRRVNGIVSVDVQQQIQKMAESKGVSMEDVIGRLLEKAIQEKELQSNKEAVKAVI